MKRLLFFSLIGLIVFSSCRQVFGKKIRGSGNITVQDHPANNFDGIDVSGAIDVYAKQDSMASVKVQTDDNLQEYLNIRQEGGMLYISVKKNYNLKPSADIKVYVTAPTFRKFDASGACEFHTEGRITNAQDIVIKLSGASDAEMDLKSPIIKADLTGAGSLTLRGETATLDLEGTGSSKLRCAEMMAENVKVSITGAGNAQVFASTKLDVHITGSGSVQYKGNPTINQSVSGAGSVKRME